MKVNKFVILLALCASMYFVLDFFFTDSIFYIVGGGIGGTIKAVFNTSSPSIVFTFWLLLLIGFIVLYYFVRNRILNILLVILIAILLYFINGVLYEIMGEITNKGTRYFHIGVGVLIKSLVLSFIIYVRQNKLAVAG